jgi:hypothetical protein
MSVWPVAKIISGKIANNRGDNEKLVPKWARPLLRPLQKFPPPKTSKKLITENII